MRYIAKGEEMQAIDAYTIEKIGIPSMVLMERAAMAVTQVIAEYVEELELVHKARILIVTEGGNNGGDGLAVGRMLVELGYQVDIYQVGGIKKESVQYRQQKEILQQLDIEIRSGITEEDWNIWKQPCYDVIVDAMFGVGLKREIQSPHREIIEGLNQLGGLKCAVDMPSGIDSTTGAVLGTAFRADVTVTFGCEKTGQLMGEGAEYCGDVLIADIGFPKQALLAQKPECYAYEESELWKIPRRRTNGNKGTFGKVTILAGSETVCGAAVLSAESAYRTGCGLVEVVTHVNNREAIQKRLPEALLHVYSNQEEAEAMIRNSIQWADAMVVGPGIGTGELGTAIVLQVLEAECPLVIDADAITILSKQEAWWKLRRNGQPFILTPHMKEMERISKIPMHHLKEAPWECARELSNKTGAICVLKDARTVVTEPDITGCYVNTSGNDGMATGGSGDVLTGVMVALIAQGMESGEAARMGVYLHGLAGDRAAELRGNYSMLAGDIIQGLEGIMATIQN